MKSKAELKSSLNTALDNIHENIVRDFHNIDVAKTNIYEETSKVGRLLDILIEDIIDNHTFFETFYASWSRYLVSPVNKENLEFLKKRFDNSIELLEKFAN